MNELREKISKILIDHGLRSDTLLLEQLLSLVDKPKVDTKEVTQTPDLEEIKKKFDKFLGNDFDKDNKSDPKNTNRWLFCWSGREDVDDCFDCACCIADEYLEGCQCICHKRVDQIIGFFTPLLATKEHDDKIREEAVTYCVNKFSGKPECTKEDPCGCHFGEVFHADGRCNCDLAREYLKSLSGDTK